MRLDKYLKVSRLIKRRTVANEACDAGRVSVNGKTAKASADVKVGDVIEIQFGTRNVKAEVLSIQESQKKEAAAFYRKLFLDIVNTAVEKKAGLLVMDEVLDACNSGMLDTRELVDFLKNRPTDMEVVLTGRNPAPELVEMADYVTQMTKKKHPFDRGIGAREGIEM